MYMINLQALEEKVEKKIKWRLLPFIFLLYLVAYLDRVNVGYAALDMNKDLGISSVAFGLLASIFFIGYACFGIPSNIMLNKFGPRKWIAGILAFWGIVATATTWVSTVNHLYIVRFLLGCAEAGFFPGIIYYMTCWFPEKQRAKAFAWLLIGIPIANIVGSPLSTYILDHAHWLNIPGWRWLFFIEGIPAIICAVLTLYVLTGSPKDAAWLTQEEKDCLINKLQHEEEIRKANRPKETYSMKQVFGILQVWRLAFIYLTYVVGGIAITLWMPQIIREFSKGLSNTQIGLVVMIPYIIAALAMWYWAWDSDRTGERLFHTALPSALAIVGLALTIMSNGSISKMIGIMITLVGSYCAYAPFWALPSLFLSEAAAAVGVAFINSFAQIGGFSGSYIVGYLNGNFGMRVVFIFLLICFAISFLLTVTMKKNKQSIQEINLKTRLQ